MRHKYKGRKLGTDYSHTKAMKKSLVSALFLNDRIKTIESRAKEIRGDVDKVITWAKKGDLHSRRLAIAALSNNADLAREVFDKVAQGMFADRNGGYTRITKLGPRKGDNAPMVIMELITEGVPAKKKKSATPKKAAPKKAAPKEDKKEEKAEAESKAEEKKAAAAEVTEDKEVKDAPKDEVKETSEPKEEKQTEDKKEEKSDEEKSE